MVTSYENYVCSEQTRAELEAGTLEALVKERGSFGSE